MWTDVSWMRDTVFSRLLRYAADISFYTLRRKKPHILVANEERKITYPLQTQKTGQLLPSGFYVSISVYAELFHFNFLFQVYFVSVFVVESVLQESQFLAGNHF